jgi:hypothetical protein
VFLDAGGAERRELPASWPGLQPEVFLPVREFRWTRGQGHLPGLWWSVTTGRHVGYESCLERYHAMLLDCLRRGSYASVTAGGSPPPTRFNQVSTASRTSSGRTGSTCASSGASGGKRLSADSVSLPAYGGTGTTGTSTRRGSTGGFSSSTARLGLHADDPTLAAAAYPQVVALARLLISPYWRTLAVGDSSAGQALFGQELRRTVAPSYQWPQPRGSRDPLYQRLIGDPLFGRARRRTGAPFVSAEEPWMSDDVTVPQDRPVSA